MQKIVIHKAGGYDQLKLETHPDPTAEKGKIVVRNQAAGVNFADIAVRLGLYASAKKYVGWPITPGFDVAGEVTAVGEGVQGIRPGDRVFGVTLFGGYSTHVALPAHHVRPIPSGINMEEAGGFPTVFITAYHALYQQANLRRGMNVLVHSAAGGVGTALLQLLKVAGCRSVGVVGSTAKVKTAVEFGASEVIDKSRDNLWATAEKLAPQGYDLILDANGVATLKESYRHLAPCGRLVSYGFHSMLGKRTGRVNWLKLLWSLLRTPRFSPLNMAQENKGVVAFNLSSLFTRTDLFEEAIGNLTQWLQEGKIRAPKVTTYPLAQAAQAQRALESGQTTGKLVLITNGVK